MPDAPVKERTLPHNLEAERSVLGAILLHNDAFNLAAEVIDSEDFFRDAHRRIFDKMVKLAERSGAIDLVTLKDELGRSGELDEVGGPAYIAAALLARGFEIDRRRLVLREPIKKLGEYAVPLKLHLDVVTNVKVKVVAEGSSQSK